MDSHNTVNNPNLNWLGIAVSWLALGQIMAGKNWNERKADNPALLPCNSERNNVALELPTTLVWLLKYSLIKLLVTYLFRLFFSRCSQLFSGELVRRHCHFGLTCVIRRRIASSFSWQTGSDLVSSGLTCLVLGIKIACNLILSLHIHDLHSHLHIFVQICA